MRGVIPEKNFILSSCIQNTKRVPSWECASDDASSAARQAYLLAKQLMQLVMTLPQNLDVHVCVRVLGSAATYLGLHIWQL